MEVSCDGSGGGRFRHGRFGGGEIALDRFDSILTERIEKKRPPRPAAQRRNYHKELHRAIADGVPVRGYFVWSFLDNFEWRDGHTRRFGICHTDFAAQRRTSKLSARWYPTVIRENRLV